MENIKVRCLKVINTVKENTGISQAIILKVNMIQAISMDMENISTMSEKDTRDGIVTIKNVVRESMNMWMVQSIREFISMIQ